MTQSGAWVDSVHMYLMVDHSSSSSSLPVEHRDLNITVQIQIVHVFTYIMYLYTLFVLLCINKRSPRGWQGESTQHLPSAWGPSGRGTPLFHAPRGREKKNSDLEGSCGEYGAGRSVLSEEEEAEEEEVVLWLQRTVLLLQGPIRIKTFTKVHLNGCWFMYLFQLLWLSKISPDIGYPSIFIIEDTHLFCKYLSII